MTARPRRGALLSVVLLAAVVALVALQVTWAGAGKGAAAPAPRAQRALPSAERPAAAPRSRIALGVTTLAFARNAAVSWRPADLREVDAFERRARRRTDLVMWFADWAHVRDFDARQAAAVAARGGTPEISWEPWDSASARADQPRYRLRRIIAGDFDAYIARWARQVAAYGAPVRLRFAQEMNGRWFPWAERANGNRRGEFVRAWRHVHAIFARAGARNVRWVWCPVAGSIQPSQYPGRTQVDVLGLAGFNGGTAIFRRQWRSFRVAFGPSLDFLHGLGRRKPIELSEVGSTEQGGSKAAWIHGMFRELRRRPEVRSVVWFNVRKEADWRIESSRSAQRAFAAEVSRGG